MLNVACCLWDANEKSQDFSRCYDESWVEKLYRAFARNLSRPFRFVCFTDHERSFCSGIEQEFLRTEVPHYGCLIEPFKLDEPTIICGLDMVILKNVDHMADYCLNGRKVAQPNHPSIKGKKINPVVFAPRGNRRIFDDWRGENDMEWLQRQDTVATDDLWPGEILSLKLHDVRRLGTQDATIVYMHGNPKPPALIDGHPWVRENWI